jgi:hypothetical protein
MREEEHFSTPLLYQRAWRVSLGRRYVGEAEVAGERVACFLPVYRTSGLAHGSVDRHR